MSKNFNICMNLTLKTKKQEMNYLNYSNALWDCLGFHIAQVGNILPDQATLPYWAIGPDGLWVLNLVTGCAN